jgi:hypothetical protein
MASSPRASGGTALLGPNMITATQEGTLEPGRTPEPARSRVWPRASLGFAFALGVWALVSWFWSRSPYAAGDFMGWRQADTQAIALNFLRPGARILWPQIDWGGDGPGYVEAEFQLFTALAAALMRVFGPAEWPGQALSLLAVLGSAVALWFHHGRREGVLAAGAAVGAFLGARAVTQTATAIQPDALGLLLYTLAWISFASFAETGRRSRLVAFGVFGAVAMLVKPTAAHVGVSSALLLFIAARPLLKRWDVWLTWALMLVVLGAYLLHAKTLHDQFGNTFGLLSGGDAKSPKLEHLLTPSIWGGALQMAVFFGLGVPGALALLWLAIVKRLTAEHAALLVSNVMITVVALRYTSAKEGGHYYAPTAVLAASLVARVVQVGSSSERLRKYGTAAVLALVLLQIGGAQWLRHRARLPNVYTQIPIETGLAARQYVEPRSLIVVRSYEPTYDVYWRTANNFQDPTIFYVSQTRGWEIGSDQTDPALIQGFIKRGARLLADPIPATEPNPLSLWLEHNAELLTATPHGGRIWRLRG